METKDKYPSKEKLKKKLEEENFKRITLSFYRYVKILSLEYYKISLERRLAEISIFGRIYIASEGINAQISVPELNFEKFKNILNEDDYLKNIPLKIAVEDSGKSFYKLKLKIRPKIVSDGLDDNAFDVTNVGKHLNADEFNKAMESPDTIVVDVRNHYESEVGHFENAIIPDVDTFREELPLIVDLLKDKKDKKVLLYCTGGIRCEKASAYLKHNGFLDVNQLLGGIISYAHEVKEKNLESKFIGKNFVFDDRLGERITNEIISKCHICGKLCDRHVNCKNDACHLLFIECKECEKEYQGCCSTECKEINSLPLESQKVLRKTKGSMNELPEHKSRLRPKLNQII